MIGYQTTSSRILRNMAWVSPRRQRQTRKIMSECSTHTYEIFRVSAALLKLKPEKRDEIREHKDAFAAGFLYFI